MAVFPPLSAPYLVKPPLARIDWSKPAAQGLAGAWVLNEGAGGRFVNLVNAAAGAQVGTLTWARGPQGAVLTGFSSSAYATVKSTGPTVGGLPAWTVVGWVRMDADVPDARAIYSERAGTGNDIAKIGTAGSASGPSGWAELTYRNDVGTLLQLQGGLITNGRWHQVVGRKSATAMTLWVDGVVVASGTFGSSSTAFTNAGVECRFGSDKGDVKAIWPGWIGMVLVYGRALSPGEILALRDQTLRAFLWAPSFSYGASAFQFARPTADTSSGTWNDQDGGSAALYAAIDEPSSDANDADYIQSAVSPASDVYIAPLSSVPDPQVSTGHIVRYRYRKDADSGDAVSLVVALMQGATTIATWTHSAVDGSLSWVTAAQTLTAAQADAITDYSALSLQFTASSP